MQGGASGRSGAGDKSPTLTPTLRRWSGGGQGAPPVEKVERIWSDLYLAQSPTSSASSPSLAPQSLASSAHSRPQSWTGLTSAAMGGGIVGEEIFKNLPMLSRNNSQSSAPASSGQKWINRWSSMGSTGSVEGRSSEDAQA
uniref:Uncharacterized protein n=1 Tax=Hemiselmis tepida TaxID=464990 RepID=A0A7S0Z1C1_9CRYP|mmetsp:Transcript_36914/g.94296  ORF Transcript_36914/g.94296 Transcript_36914/m.94296 type:complete len:141 (+) Transcript_36914:218-640(+)|eukprot:CAMPEP_0174929272 /NCGR_PEP_ID=MMETSP1355-20121228/27114_1 /TAXON_ID=464990 /ORGANISM="Hemiselmis tepida, Strain CCMP443" /LENGTH=140 /DNA_ID=CAMNT_0016175465 /DNA_START=193 /DNA_END=615 /DNA_ORIENTATION=+